MDSPVIDCVQCGTQLRGPFCWKCGAASVAAEPDTATVQLDRPGGKPQSSRVRPVLEGLSLRPAAVLAVAFVVGIVALVSPVVALLLPLAYLAVITWSTAKETYD